LQSIRIESDSSIARWSEAYAIAEGVLYIGTWVWHPEWGLPVPDDSPFYAFDTRSGKMLWKITDGVHATMINGKFHGKGGFFGPPIVAD